LCKENPNINNNNNAYPNLNRKNLISLFDEHPNVNINDKSDNTFQNNLNLNLNNFKKSNKIDLSYNENSLNSLNSNSIKSILKVERKCECRLNYSNFQERNDKILMNYARNLFDQKEFQKCSHILKHIANEKNTSALFLYFYSEYNVNEQRKQEDIIDNTDINTKTPDYNKNLMLIYQKLKDYYNKQQLDVFSMYLFGVICKEVNQISEAKTVLIQTLNYFPYLWSAWLELLSISKTNDMNLLFRELDNHWMKYFFKASFYAEKDLESDAIDLCNGLLTKFPNSIFLIDTIAHSYYCLQGN